MKFCKDCRNFCRSIDGDLKTGWWCFIPIGYVRTAIRIEKAYRNFDPTKRNAMNNCVDYRRKWWKFWIRETMK